MNEKKQVAHNFDLPFLCKHQKIPSLSVSNKKLCFRLVFWWRPFASPRASQSLPFYPLGVKVTDAYPKASWVLGVVEEKSMHIWLCLFSQASFCKSAVPGWDFSSPSIGSHASPVTWWGMTPKTTMAGKLESPPSFMCWNIHLCWCIIFGTLQPLSETTHLNLIVTGILPLKTNCGCIWLQPVVYSKAFHTFYPPWN